MTCTMVEMGVSELFIFSDSEGSGGTGVTSAPDSTGILSSSIGSSTTGFTTASRHWKLLSQNGCDSTNRTDFRDFPARTHDVVESPGRTHEFTEPLGAHRFCESSG